MTKARNKILLPSAVSSDEGFALVTALVFAAILMATMTIIINKTILETIMSGASTVSKRALSTADAGVEYVRGSFVLIGNDFPVSTSVGNYTNTVKATSSGIPAIIRNNVVFVNLSSMGKDNSLLSNTGFSGKYSTASSGGSGMNLSAYRSRISSVGTVRSFRKNVEFQGFSLAP
jgi:hypothetical protein